jgi:predicted RND superfamily exporter protein
MTKHNKTEEKDQNFIGKLSAFIVDKRKAFFLLYICLCVFCVFSSGWVKVNKSLTDYLPGSTETRQGLTIMDREFVTYATANVMVDNISYEQAETLVTELKKIKGVKSIEFDNTKKHFRDASALLSVTFSGESEDAVSQEALNSVQSALSQYDTYVTTDVGDQAAETIASEMKIVMLIVVIIILAVLLFTSHTYMEIPVLVLTFGVAAMLNKGTNFLFGTISFVSNSVAVVLQLALAIDYAIILCHRYTEERERMDARSATITALSKAIPEISGSSLTTLSGLAAMTLMQFRIGYDMGIVLIKAIVFSLLCVFTLMPGLLMSFSKLIDHTHHKSFVPKITGWSRLVVKLRYVVPPLFLVLLVASFYFSSRCPYAFGGTLLSTAKKNQEQIAKEKINSTFGKTNTIAMLVPAGNYDDEAKLLKDMKSMKEIDSVTGLANVDVKDGYTITSKLTPRQFAELTDLDIEPARILYSAYAAKQKDYGKIAGGTDHYSVPLIDMFLYAYDQVQDGYVTLDDKMNQQLDDLHRDLTDAQLQLKGKNYSRFVLKLNIPEEGKEAFSFLTKLHQTAAKYYDNGSVYLVGNSTSDRDISESFQKDNILVSVLSAVFVMLILLFTFQSAGIPVLLILIIQGSIWMNFSFPFLQGKYLFFMSYLVVSSIQMGANIDYAIVITNRYVQLKRTMPIKEAMVETLNQAFPTIITSGSILSAAGFLIGRFTSNSTISSIGTCLGRGTVISIVLVMTVLPQMILLGDTIIEKTSFLLKIPATTQTRSGNLRLDGHVRGFVNGVVDADFSGTLRGTVSAVLESGKLSVSASAQNEENIELKAEDGGLH